jgi:hypothetical protein
MLRPAAILLACAFGLLGSGLLRHVHAHAHELQDRAAGHCHAAHDDCSNAPADAGDRPLHDETNCELHASLAAPIVSAGFVPLLICLGLFVAFLTQVEPPLDPQRTPARVDCRGPPA